MGCGSSSKVETISQEESNPYSRNTPAKQRENGPAEPEQRRPTPKSRGSSASSSNESHDRTRARRKTSGGSRRSTGSARKTETAKTDIQVISSTSGQVDIDKNTDENEEKEIHTRVNMINTNDIKESHTTKDEKHEEISGLVEERRSGSRRSIGSARKAETEQTDVQEISSTGEHIDIKKNIDENEKDEIDICVNIINTNVAKVSDMERAEKHEERAKIAEERRSKANREDMHNREIEAMQLAGIDVEDKVEAVTSSNIYTIDDKVNHNTKVGARDWFIYGRNVYSVDLMLPLVKERMAGYSKSKKSDCYDYCFYLNFYQVRKFDEKLLSLQIGYPIYVARNHGVTRKELKKVLSVCLIGKIVDVDRDIKIERLKQSVENTLEALGKPNEHEYRIEPDSYGEYIYIYRVAYGDQLNRWLHDYPNVQIYNKPPEMGVDPNSQSFPLPKAILLDPLPLRKWLENWKKFDHEVPGEAAWNVIEVDIIRKETTTEEQEKTLSAREKRKNLHDPAWQAKRRSEIANALIARHKMDPNVITPYMSLYENLEIAWKQFQELCLG